MRAADAALAGSLSFVGGVGVYSFAPFGWSAAAGAALCSIVFFQKGGMRAAGVAFFSFWAGVLALAISFSNWQGASFFLSPFFGRTGVMEGTIASVQELRDRQYLTVKENTFAVSVSSSRVQVSVPGKVRVRVGSSFGVLPGQRIEFTCALQRPVAFSSFDYPAFLAQKGIYSECFPKGDIVVKGNSERVQSRLFSFAGSVRNAVRKQFSQFLPEYDADVLSALILGMRGVVPERILSSFQRIGISHILAVSGLHVAVLSVFFWTFLVSIGVSRNASFWIVSLLLLSFLLVLGFRASAVRAAVMAWTALAGSLLGRPAGGIRALVYAAAALVLWKPMLLRWDAGFQLSFLAVLSILLWHHPIDNFLKRMRFPQAGAVRMRTYASVSLAAQAGTALLVSSLFGTFSFMSIAANLLLLPLLPFFLVGGIALAATAAVFPVLASGIASFLSLLFSYTFAVTDMLSRLPYAAVSITYVPAWILVVFYGGVGYAAWRRLQWHNRKENPVFSSSGCDYAVVLFSEKLGKRHGLY